MRSMGASPFLLSQVLLRQQYHILLGTIFLNTDVHDMKI